MNKKGLYFIVIILVILLCLIVVYLLTKSPKYHGKAQKSMYCAIVQEINTSSIYLACNDLPQNLDTWSAEPDTRLKKRYLWDDARWIQVDEEWIDEKSRYLNAYEVHEQNLVNVKTFELNTFPHTPLLKYLENQNVINHSNVAISASSDTTQSDTDSIISLKFREDFTEYYMSYIVSSDKSIRYLDAFQEIVIY